MKVWEIKAEALRLMFTDTDLTFSEEEFLSGILLENSNTREKLIRMEDSIKRGIDQFYHLVGDKTKVKNFILKTSFVGQVGSEILVYNNEIDCSLDNSVDYPVRIDLSLYRTNGNLRELVAERNQISFNFDEDEKKIFFFNEDYSRYKSDIVFRVWYKMKKANLPAVLNQMEYDLNVLHIPEEVQRMIPYYVKAELFEEDEPNIANNARNIFTQFLLGIKKPNTNTQTKVKRSPIFDK